MPSVEDVVKSLTGEGATKASMTDTVQSVKEQMTEQMKTPEVTEALIRSAIDEEPLVVEEVVPEINLESIEAVDSRTGRYPPRLKLSFVEFPLRKISTPPGTLNGQGASGDGNAAMATDIIRRIQARLKLDTVRFEFRDRTARLSGTVPTLRQRELAEVMLRLEPGIDTIKNEIVVAEAVP